MGVNHPGKTLKNQLHTDYFCDLIAKSMKTYAYGFPIQLPIAVAKPLRNL